MLKIQDFLLDNTPILYYIIVAIGAIPILYQLFIIIRGFLALILRKKINIQKVYGSESWALVTGSSDGIGKQFAIQLAKQGLNIILLARTQSKLKLVKQEILKDYPHIKVEILVKDLIQQGKKDKLQDILPQLSKFEDISIVVNNAGVDVLNKFTDLKIPTIIDLVSINVFALGSIIYKFIPYFEQRSKKTGKKCAFINVGSVAGQMPVPLHNIYSASKGYVNQLTCNLARQYPDIDWLLLNPSEVSTAMTCYTEDIFSVSPKQCVQGTLKDLGHQLITNGALNHKIQSYLYTIIPGWIFNPIFTKIIGPQYIQKRRLFQKKQ